MKNINNRLLTLVLLLSSDLYASNDGAAAPAYAGPGWTTSQVTPGSYYESPSTSVLSKAVLFYSRPVAQLAFGNMNKAVKTANKANAQWTCVPKLINGKVLPERMIGIFGSMPQEYRTLVYKSIVSLLTYGSDNIIHLPYAIPDFLKAYVADKTSDVYSMIDAMDLSLLIKQDMKWRIGHYYEGKERLWGERSTVSIQQQLCNMRHHYIDMTDVLQYEVNLKGIKYIVIHEDLSDEDEDVLQDLFEKNPTLKCVFAFKDQTNKLEQRSYVYSVLDEIRGAPLLSCFTRERAIGIALAGIASPDLNARSFAIEILCHLVRNGRYEEAKKVALRDMTSADQQTRINAFSILRVLVQNGHAYEEAELAASAGIASRDRSTNQHAFYLIKDLVENGRCEEVKKIALRDMASPDQQTRGIALDILRLFVRNGHTYEEAELAASAALASPNIRTRNQAIELFVILAQNGRYEEVRKIALRDMPSAQAIRLLEVLAQKIHGKQP